MNESDQQCVDYNRIAAAIDYINVNFQAQPSLDEIAAAVHLSKYHFQRLFKRWAGVSPTQFMRYLTIEYAKEQLAQSSVNETAMAVGLSSQGRLHDLFVTFEAMTPGEFKQHGANVTIRYNCYRSPFGQVLLARTDRGICALRFGGRDLQQQLDMLRKEWHDAVFVEQYSAEDEAMIRTLYNTSETPYHLHLKGTNFQVQVWQALLQVPEGTLRTYSNIATAIGKPTAVRAVASAIANNPVGYIIPCHRVINNRGETHRYRWGATRKQAMLCWEASRGHA